MVEIIQKAGRQVRNHRCGTVEAPRRVNPGPESGIKRCCSCRRDLPGCTRAPVKITAMYYEMLKDTCQVDIMPALGTHDRMSEAECREVFREKVPLSNIVVHNWRNEVVKIGEVPGEYVREVSEGLWISRSTPRSISDCSIKAMI